MAVKVMVNLPDEPSYAVRIGEGILCELGNDIRSTEALNKRTSALVVSDSNVAPLYMGQAKASLEAVGFSVSEIVVPAGEDSKSVEVAAEIWSAMAGLELGRDCVVIALGGGVVGDLAGFVAATYMRGVPVVQVPTTLLAMVDSSVGGKTGINLPEGKNLVGAFYQPSLVCADTSLLATLNEREWRCGCAEIAKSAAIDSDDFFFWLSENAEALAARNLAVTAEAIKRCVVFKAGVVAADKTESAGVRECLNFGHTLGHAIEATSGYGTYSHGAAVAEGMRFALDLQGTARDSSFAQATKSLLDTLGLSKLDWHCNPELALEAMKHDKKNRGGEIRFVLVKDVADWAIVPVDEQRLLAAMKSAYGGLQ